MPDGSSSWAKIGRKAEAKLIFIISRREDASISK
jgi:hypothetical protein